MKKGEVWVLNLQFTKTREQSGARPGIVISDTQTGMILTVPLTSNIQALRFPHTLEIRRSEKNGLEKDSIALAFQIQSLDKNRFLYKIGNIEDRFLRAIDLLLKKLLEI